MLIVISVTPMMYALDITASIKIADPIFDSLLMKYETIIRGKTIAFDINNTVFNPVMYW